MGANFPQLIFFVTHSHKDNEFVRRLVDDLYRAGLQGFCDLDAIKPGDSFIERINQGLESCTIYVPVLSNDVLDSPWCKTEIYAALELSHRRGREGCPRIRMRLMGSRRKLHVFLICGARCGVRPRHGVSSRCCNRCRRPGASSSDTCTVLRRLFGADGAGR